MGHRSVGIAAVGLAVALLVAGCSGGPELAPAVRPLSKESMMLLGKKGMKVEAPIFVRIFKEESELELWKLRDDGHFHHFKTYPICTWSGDLGPKLQQGDKQAPEGFYTVAKSQMNPNSNFYLAFNLGFPNSFDRAHGRTGSALMVHGKCKSAGCYAMTDALIEEIYALARDPFDAGQASFQVHAYPFRMTDANMERHKGSRWLEFWKTLKEGHDHFEATRVPPPVVVCGRRYVVNVRPLQNASTRVDPANQCPALERLPAEPFVPKVDQQSADARTIAPGPKLKGTSTPTAIAGNSDGAGRATGLFGTPSAAVGMGFASSSN